MPLLTKKRVVAAAVETTEGTPISSLGASDIDLIAEDVEYSPDFQIIERNVVGPSFARKKARTTTKLARVTFRTEMKGSGTLDTAPAWGLFIDACGFSETVNASTSVVYTPVVPTNETYGAGSGNIALTIWVFEDGKVKKATGCRGTVRFVGESGGKAYLEFEFLGEYAAPVDTAYPDLTSASFDSTESPLVESAAFSFHGLTAGTPILRSFTIDMGNTLVPRFDASSSGGIKNILITDSLTTASLDPEDPLIAETNWGSADPLIRMNAETLGAFSLAVGTAAGNILTFTAPNSSVQVTGVTYSDRDSLVIANMTCSFNAPDGESATVQRILLTHT